MCACDTYLPIQADTKKGCSRTFAKPITKYGVSVNLLDMLAVVNLLDMLAVVVLHDKRQCNATDNEVRIPSYIQKLHHNYPDF